MRRQSLSIVALVGAAVAIVVLSWLDTVVIADTQRRAAAEFNSALVAPLWSLSEILVAATILGLGAVAWRSRSVAVGAVYTVVGAALAFLPVILATLATGRNGAAPVLPPDLSRLVFQLFEALVGPMSVVITLGGGLLVIGLVVLARSLRGRDRAFRSTASVQPETSVAG